MRKFLALMMVFVFGHSPVFYECKRLKLSKRLYCVFNRDLKEGINDSATRLYL
ncbi:MAG: hypothetical protein IJG39_01925 [Synergistaceae bacterium]|nr:hypothetical protein [Synergistaceae bacterium]